MIRCLLGSLLLLMCGGCRLGRPPISGVHYQIGAVEAGSAEPAMPELIESGLGRALAEHSRLGSGPEVQVQVLKSSTSVGAVGEGQQVHRIHLSLSVSVISPEPRSLVVEGSRSYTVGDGETIAASASRMAAVEALVMSLMKDAVDWILFAPGGA